MSFLFHRLPPASVPHARSYVQSAVSLPYHVPRNTRGSIPVYTDIRNAGTRNLTLIRNVQGNTDVRVPVSPPITLPLTAFCPPSILSIMSPIYNYTHIQSHHGPYTSYPHRHLHRHLNRHPLLPSGARQGPRRLPPRPGLPRGTAHARTHHPQQARRPLGRSLEARRDSLARIKRLLTTFSLITPPRLESLPLHIRQ